MRNRCKNNYIGAFGAVYWAKNAVLKKSQGPHSEDEVNHVVLQITFVFQYILNIFFFQCIKNLQP